MFSANKTTKEVTCLQVTLGFVRIMLISLILSPFGGNFISFRREELCPLSGLGFEIQLKLQSKLGKLLVLFITFLVRSIGSRSDLRCLRAEWLDRSAASPGPRADPWPNYRKVNFGGIQKLLSFARSDGKLTCSTCRNTRIRFRPASRAMSSSDHRSESASSSANK